MSKLNLKQNPVGVLILLVILLVLPANVLAQDEDDEDRNPRVCNPVMVRLAEEMGEDCEDLLALQQEGHGLGEIIKAWYLSQSSADFDGTW